MQAICRAGCPPPAVEKPLYRLWQALQMICRIRCSHRAVAAHQTIPANSARLLRADDKHLPLQTKSRAIPHNSKCRYGERGAAAAGAVLKPSGGNYAVLPILSQVAGHLLLLKSSNYSRLISKEILCTEIQIVLFNKLNTKIALYSRHFTSRFHVFVYQAACQLLPSLSPYQLSPFSLSRQIPSFGRLF